MQDHHEAGSRSVSAAARPLKVLVLAVCIGLLSGVLATIFGKGVDFFTEVRQEHPMLLLLLPAVGLAIRWVYDTFGKDCGKGMALVFGVSRGEMKFLPMKLIPLTVGSTWMGHLFGASVGREGVAVQMCATVASRFAALMPDRQSRRTLLLAGIAGGFGGLFRTPITAVFFAMELFHVGVVEYTAVLPALLAAEIASLVSGQLGLGRFHGSMGTIPALDAANLTRIVVLSVAAGLVGMLFAQVMHRAGHVMEKLFPNAYVRIAAAGVLMTVLGFLCAGRYNGVGEVLAEAALNGGTVYAWDWLVKMVLTAMCLSVGFQGGEVMPLFTVGATMGAVLGPVLGLPMQFSAALCYCATFSAGTNTFLTPIMVSGELFGFENLPLFFMAIAIAYVFNGNHSIYPQVEVHGDWDNDGILDY